MPIFLAIFVTPRSTVKRTIAQIWFFIKNHCSANFIRRLLPQWTSFGLLLPFWSLYSCTSWCLQPLVSTYCLRSASRCLFGWEGKNTWRRWDGNHTSTLQKIYHSLFIQILITKQDNSVAAAVVIVHIYIMYAKLINVRHYIYNTQWH